MTQHIKKPSRNERVWATLCQLLGLFFGTAFLITALIWLFKRKSSEFINKSGKEALNFQLSVLVYFFLGYAIAWIIFIESPKVITWNFYHIMLFRAGFYRSRGLVEWLLIAIVLWIGFVFYQSTRAILRASHGILYRYEAIVRFIK